MRCAILARPRADGRVLGRALRRLLAVPVLALPAAAQLATNTLIADINAEPSVVGSFSGAFASNGTLAWFTAVDEASGDGYRLWSTDGTTAGTVQLASVALNVHEAEVDPFGEVWIAADELGIGVGLWRSDGTAAGTAQILAPQGWTVDPYDVTAFAGAIWFLAGRADTGVELWKADPVSGAVALAQELAPGPISGCDSLLACAASLLVANPLGVLFATDGTPGGATAIEAFAQPGPDSFDRVAQVGARAIFNVGGFSPEGGWWASDGTPAGTVLLAKTFNDAWIVQGATRAYLTAGSVASTPLLFETDGTPAGTLPIDLPGGSGGQRVELTTEQSALAVGDQVFYSGLVPGLGFEPCTATSAAAGAQLLVDVHPGGSSSPSDLVAFGGRIVFRAEGGGTGREVWSVDPASPSGSLLLAADTFPGPFAAIVSDSPTLWPTANGVIFGWNFAQFGVEPAVTDGVTSALLKNIGDDGASAGSNPKDFARLGDRVLFQAYDETVGIELWSTDGTLGGLQLVADIDPTLGGFPGAFGSTPHHLVPFGDRVAFYAGQPSTGFELWITDGTPAGTTLLKDVIPGPVSSEPLFSRPPVEVGGVLLFIARNASGGLELWRSDGTTAGTTKMLTTDPVGFLTELVFLERFGDFALFRAGNPMTGAEIWSSDGTLQGTRPLADMTPGADSTLVSRFAAGDTWAAIQVLSGSENALWRTDGTPAGTSKFLSWEFGGSPSGGGEMAFAGDTLVTRMTSDGAGIEPWFSDGTPGGTQPLADIVPGEGSSSPTGHTRSGGLVYFATQSPPGSLHHPDLWRTDGTPAGTSLVASFVSPVSGGGIGEMWPAGDNGGLVFGNTDANGLEWWATDGTPAGTFPLADIAPGPKSSKPTPGALLGGTLVFSSDDGSAGVELHAMPFDLTGGFATTSLGGGCAGSHGVPAIGLASGAPTLGDAFAIGLERAAPGGLAAWAFDDAYAGPLPVGACGSGLVSPLLLGATPVDGSGASQLAATLPATPSLAGAVVLLQALSVESGGPFLGIGATSNVLEIVVGP